MKTKELLASNPNVTEALHKWMFDKLTESFKDFDKDEAFKDYILAKGVSDNQVQSVVELNPRSCFDLLDSHGIIVTVKHQIIIGQPHMYKAGGWTNNYYPSEDNKVYDSRLTCEKAGLILGIVELEKILEDAKGNKDNTGDEDVSSETDTPGKD